MACMVFISTSMTSMSLHYCGGQIAGIGLFDTEQDPASCCLVEQSKCEQESEDDCCKDEYVELDWDVDIAIQSHEIQDNEVDIVAILSSFQNIVINSPQATSSPQTYIPPLLQGDRIVLFQQFLC